jgi:hypothetical protein
MPAIHKEEFQYVHIPTTGGRRLHLVDPGEGETLCSRPLPIHLGGPETWGEGWDLLSWDELDPGEMACQNCARIARARARAAHEADVIRRIAEEKGRESQAALADMEGRLQRALGAIEAWRKTGEYASECVGEVIAWLEKLRTQSASK